MIEFKYFIIIQIVSYYIIICDSKLIMTYCIVFFHFFTYCIIYLILFYYVV